MTDFQFADHLSQVVPPNPTNTARAAWVPNHNSQGETLLFGHLQVSETSAQGLRI